MNHWQRLGLAPTLDKKAVKRAYRDLLKVNNPEDDQEAFMAIRQAYDAVLAEIKHGGSVELLVSSVVMPLQIKEADEFKHTDDAGAGSRSRNKSSDDDGSSEDASGEGERENLSHLDTLFESGIATLHTYTKEQSVNRDVRRDKGELADSDVINVDIDGMVEEALLLMSAVKPKERNEAWRFLLQRAEILSPLAKAEFVSALGYLCRKHLPGCWLLQANDPEGLPLVMQFLNGQYVESPSNAEAPYTLEQLEATGALASDYQEQRSGSLVRRAYELVKRFASLFSVFSGRVGRRVFILSVSFMLALPFIVLTSGILTSDLSGTAASVGTGASNGVWLFSAILLAMLVSVAALSVKRMRDAGGQFWVLALIVIPVLIPVPLFWLFLVGPNGSILQRRPLFYSRRGFQRRLHVAINMPNNEA